MSNTNGILLVLGAVLQQDKPQNSSNFCTTPQEKATIAEVAEKNCSEFVGTLR